MPELTPAELAQQPGPAALLDAFRALGGEASPRELQLRAQMAPSTVSKWLAELRRAGLVEGPKPKPHLTHEGWALADRPAVVSAGDRAELDAAISRWPAEPQRAFLRQLVAAVTARWHLGGQRPLHHPGFIAAGRTGTGKTSMAHFVCRAFGLDPEAHVIYLASRTAGEVLGRREYGPEDGVLRYTPSPLLGRPLLVFDEFDKATREQQRAALLCFQGDTRAVIEETPVQLRAAPMLACNTYDGLPVPPEYRRRSVVVDMDPVADLLDDLDLALRELEAAGGPPRLDLEALRPPLARLPEDAYGLLRDVLHRALTPEGRRLCNVPSVELTALGYAAGAELDDVKPAALALTAARDYLTCAETVEETREGWRRELAGLSGDDAAAALKTGEAERERVEVIRRRRAEATAREALELVGARQELAERLRQARPDARKLLPEHRPAGQGLRAQLDHLRDDVLASRSEARLAELGAPAEALLASVRELVDRDNRARAAAAAQVDQERRQQQLERERRQAEQRSRADLEAQQRRAAAAAARQAREQAAQRRRTSRELLDSVRAQAKTLEGLWRRSTDRGESALTVLARTEAFGRPLLVFEEERPAPGQGFLDRLVGAVGAMQGAGMWSSPFDPAVHFFGTRTSAEGLTWGVAARRVLGPPLAHLHAREAELETATGLKPRKGRLQVHPQPALPR